jgi:hypothetical protein
MLHEWQRQSNDLQAGSVSRENAFKEMRQSGNHQPEDETKPFCPCTRRSAG